jgi:eukaryotic-like serine/threonine-protein kinase
MNRQDQLEELLVDWGVQRQQGNEITAEELCKDKPEFVADMSQLIRDLKSTDWLEEDNDVDDDFLQLPEFNTVSRQADETLLPECKLNIDQFAAAIAGSGLMDSEKVQQFRDDHPTDEPLSFARELVAANKLTRFQATVLLDERDQPLLLDRYIILDEIGSGGMGAVFKALHVQMDRVVALKILPRAAVDSPDKVARFHREVRAAAKLEHPNIVTAFDAHESKGIHYLVMSYVNGSDLSQTVRKQGPLSVTKTVDCVMQAATGLEHAHQQGIAHRDVKPANLLLDKQGTLKILDMGLARIDTADPEHGKTVTHELTQAGTMMGTVDYIAPEQAMDTRDADGRSDIYSLGCTLYYLLTGSPIYAEDTIMKTVMAHQQNTIPSLRRDRDDVPEELNAVYEKMVAKKPADRYQSMIDVITALEAIVIDERQEAEVRKPVVPEPQALHETATFIDTGRDVVEPQPAAGSSQPPKRRRPLIAAGLWGFGGLLLLAGILITIQTPDGDIVIESNIADFEVFVDSKKVVTITDPKDKGKITVEVKPGAKVLSVSKDGFEADVKEFTLKSVKGPIKVTFVPVQKTKTAEPSHDKLTEFERNRLVAERIIEIGGKLGIDNDGDRGNHYEVSSLDKLPENDFHLNTIDCTENTKLTDDVLEELHRLHPFLKTTFLEFGGTAITSHGLAHLAGWSVPHLVLNGNTAVAGRGLQHLQEIKELSGLHLNKVPLAPAQATIFVS